MEYENEIYERVNNKEVPKNEMTLEQARQKMLEGL